MLRIPFSFQEVDIHKHRNASWTGELFLEFLRQWLSKNCKIILIR